MAGRPRPLVLVGIAVLAGGDAAREAPVLRIPAVLGACVASAAGTVVVKAYPRSHPAAMNAVGMVVAFAILLVVSAVQRDPWTLPADQRSAWAVAYLVASSLILFPLAVWVIGEWTASASAYAMVVAPLVTRPVAAFLLDESLSGRFGVAAALVLLGVYVGALRRVGRLEPAPPAPAAP